MPTLDIQGSSFEVLDRGQGSPVLFVHGFPLSHAMWEFQIEALENQHRVLAPDLRGFGHSSVSPGIVTMEQFADDLAAILEEFQIKEPVTLCGLSMGGYIAWPFVRKYPQRLRALILCDTKATPDTPEAVENRHRLAESVLKHGSGVTAQAMPEKLFAAQTLQDQPDIVDRCKAMMLQADPEGIAAALRGMAERPDMSSLLPGISAPTLVLVGAEDQLTPAEEMRTMASAIPQATFVEVENAGHMPPMEQPALVNAALTHFLAQL